MIYERIARNILFKLVARGMIKGDDHERGQSFFRMHHLAKPFSKHGFLTYLGFSHSALGSREQGMFSSWDLSRWLIPSSRFIWGWGRFGFV